MAHELGARRPRRPSTAIALILTLAAGTERPTAEQQEGRQQEQRQQQPPETPRFETFAGVSIVSVDVVVRDSSGNVVRGLTAKDFVVSEDGKAQKIETFSFQEIAAAAPGAADVQLLDGLEDKVRAEAARAASATSSTTAPAATPAEAASLLNRRMLTIVFDVSSMQPDDVQRAVEDAREWVGGKMTGATVPMKGLLSGLLYDVAPTDAAMLAPVAALLLIAGLCACYLPARRAARVDPIVTLRAE